MSALLEPPATIPQPPAKDAKPKIVIPQIGKITIPAAKTEPKEGAPKVESTPANKEEPGLDTSAIPLPESRKVKTPAEYAAERRESKVEKAKVIAGVPELEAELTATKAQLAEFEKIKAEAAQYERRVAEFEALQKEREAEIERLKTTYFEQHKATYNPADDEELRTASGTVQQTLLGGMPAFLPSKEGTPKRSVFDQYAKTAEGQGYIDQAMSNYVAAYNEGNDEKMNLAVNFMAQLSGSDAVVFSRDPDEQALLDLNDPSFREIETAMRKAMPSYMTKKQRERFVVEQAPVLAQQALQQRQATVSANLRKAVFLDPEVAAARAEIDPLDAGVVMNQIVQHSPELKEHLDRYIAFTAPTFARIQFQDSTLASNDPKAIEAHRAGQLHHQKVGGEIMQKAMLGEIAPYIITELMGQLQALTLRAGDISANENPGGNNSGDSTASPPNSHDISAIPLPEGRRA